MIRKASIYATTVLLSVLLVGCSSLNPIDKSNKATSSSPIASQDITINQNESLLTSIQTLAAQGKIINCDFPVKSTTIDAVEKKWGKADKTEWVAAAKGVYATFSKHHVVFGFNKGSQIFEARSFDSQLSKLTLSTIKDFFGKPAYEITSGGGKIIGYVASKEFKILFVFKQPTTESSNPSLDHYSVLYPQGTVNLMADDPGRQW